MNKWGLCIGINNYPGTGSDLRGCVNDAKDWQQELESRGFKATLMLDDVATKETIKHGIRELLLAAQPGDSVVITYSGHGTWVPDENGDEPDLRDEALVPHDIMRAGPLLDDELNDLFAERRPSVRLVFVSDACHSGTSARRFAKRVDTSLPRVRFLPPEHFLSPELMSHALASSRPRIRGRSRSSALLLAACRDLEYSFDSEFDRRPNGAFTFHALAALEALPRGATYRDWAQRIRESLPSPNYPQRPQLSGTRSQQSWRALE